MYISLSVFGDEVFSRKLLRFGESARKLDRVYPVLADHFHEIEKRAFATEGASQGAKWTPLSPRYAAWKARRYPGKPILEREGHLKESLTSFSHSGSVFDKSAEGMFVGSSIDYGKYHQSRAPRTQLPRRPPVEFTERDAQQWVNTIQLYLSTGELRAPAAMVRGM